MSDLIEASPSTRLTTTALRHYGTWGETPHYDFTQAPQGHAVAVKRFTWTMPAVTLHGGFPLALSYYATASADPRKMNDLAYLAGVERQALDQLEAMVLKALQGTAYVAVPHPVGEVQKDVVQTLREWVEQGGYPATWAETMQGVIAAAFQRLALWKERVQTMQGRLDPEHPKWGLAVEILPLEPRGEASA